MERLRGGSTASAAAVIAEVPPLFAEQRQPLSNFSFAGVNTEGIKSCILCLTAHTDAGRAKGKQL